MVFLTEGVAKGVQKWIYRKWPNFTKLASSTPLGVRNSVPKNFWNRISTLAGNSIFRNLVPLARIEFQILGCCPGSKFRPIWKKFGPGHIRKVPKKRFLPFPGFFFLFFFNMAKNVFFINVFLSQKMCRFFFDFTSPNCSPWARLSDACQGFLDKLPYQAEKGKNQFQNRHFWHFIALGPCLVKSENFWDGILWEIWF